MTKLPAHIACTCDDFEQMDLWDHDFRCGLFDFPGFADEGREFMWDPIEQRLFEFDDLEEAMGEWLEREPESFDDKNSTPVTPTTYGLAVIGEAKCECPVEPDYLCLICNVERSDPTAPWEHDNNRWDASGKPVVKASNWLPKCRHWRQPVVFPTGTTVYASSWLAEEKQKHNDNHPDFGLYLASSWSPTNLGFLVPWADYGLPKCKWEQVIHAGEQALKLARAGSIVEVGCLGGHGRTGAMLAVIGVLDGMPADEVVQWVRKNYCDEAIECAEQEWFPRWVEAKVKGITPLPKKPKSKVLIPYKPKTTPHVVGSFAKGGK